MGLGKGKIKRRCSGVGEVLEVVMARDDSLVATELTIVLYICIFRDDDGRQPTLR